MNMTKARILDRSLWERKYLDLWTIAHFLTGMCFGFAIFFYNPPVIESFVIFSLFVIIWEVIEHFQEVGEPVTNQVADVLAGAAGFIVTILTIPILTPDLFQQIIYFTVLYSITWTLAYHGFLSFALHSNKDMKKYGQSFFGAAIIYIAIILAIIVI